MSSEDAQIGSTPSSDPEPRQEMKRDVTELIKMVVLFLIVFWGLKAFVIEGYEVQGDSMIPTLEDRERILVFKLPTKLAMSWDDRVSFVLTEGLQLKKIAFQDTVFEGQKQDDAGFDADVAIATGELSKLIPDLILALGGEGRGEIGGAATPVNGALHAPTSGPDDDAPF